MAVLLFACLWMGTACNLPLWGEVLRLPGAHTLRGGVFSLAFMVAVSFATAAVLSLFAWGKALKPVLALAVVAAAAGAYFMGTYGIVIDPGMITNVAQTDAREAADLLT